MIMFGMAIFLIINLLFLVCWIIYNLETIIILLFLIGPVLTEANLYIYIGFYQKNKRESNITKSFISFIFLALLILFKVNR
jgi:hypothetical protein